jgi:hypothetical protein
MRISTAPTPFDSIPSEDRQAWLNQGPTEALRQAVKDRIAELTTYLCENISLTDDDHDVGATYRAVRYQRDAYVAMRDWVFSAEVPRG